MQVNLNWIPKSSNFYKDEDDDRTFYQDLTRFVELLAGHKKTEEKYYKRSYLTHVKAEKGNIYVKYERLQQEVQRKTDEIAKKKIFLLNGINAFHQEIHLLNESWSGSKQGCTFNFVETDKAIQAQIQHLKLENDQLQQQIIFEQYVKMLSPYLSELSDHLEKIAALNEQFKVQTTALSSKPDSQIEHRLYFETENAFLDLQAEKEHIKSKDYGVVNHCDLNDEHKIHDFSKKNEDDNTISRLKHEITNLNVEIADLSQLIKNKRALVIAKDPDALLDVESKASEKEKKEVELRRKTFILNLILAKEKAILKIEAKIKSALQSLETKIKKEERGEYEKVKELMDPTLKKTNDLMRNIAQLKATVKSSDEIYLNKFESRKFFTIKYWLRLKGLEQVKLKEENGIIERIALLKEKIKLFNESLTIINDHELEISTLFSSIQTYHGVYDSYYFPSRWVLKTVDYLWRQPVAVAAAGELSSSSSSSPSSSSSSALGSSAAAASPSHHSYASSSSSSSFGDAVES